MALIRTKLLAVTLTAMAWVDQPVMAQDSSTAPCVTSVVLRRCPDRQETPFQSEAERADASARQQMQDQFASTDEMQQRRATQAEQDLDSVTVYGHLQAPQKPALAEFSTAVAKSGPKDCRNAYATSGARGRFGLSDLIYDTVTGKPCAWK